MYSNTGNFITKSLNQNQKIIIKYLPVILSDFNKKDLHKVRVTIKKMNATYRLLEFLIPGGFDYKKHYQKLEDIFQSIGKLRELQLYNSYIDHYHLPVASQKLYSKFHSSEIIRTKRKNKEVIKQFDKDSFHNSTKSVKKLIQNLNDEKILVKIMQFIANEANGIKNLFQDYDNPVKIHIIRKILKSLTYNAETLNNLKSSRKISNLIPRLKEAETLIGIWHDKVALIKFINRLIEKNLGSKPDSIEPFNNIITRLSAENRNILSQLKPKLEDIIATISSPLLFNP